ncbi:Uncharacterized protein OBRU01_14508 [Operophtera brumata]|uniref:Mic1 domain-containing protein n=1 Tax=Operophtera brumata TaxID=104452 RepID=A0A0L7L640_OPEBR|nr:Uncharacterized protein OBRU01_14508 [Operophtera brumata]
MVNFNLKDSDEYYLCLSDQPKRFDADSPATNVFFDDTNGQVFTVRSGGVTGVTVSGMDESKSTSFRMEDRGPIISIKFSPDQNILAIQRNQDSQNATVEFVNFKDLAPTNVEYSHTCKWKNAKILGFVWPKVNEIAFITDHGIELLQVLPEKKQLKSLKNTTFSGAWFQWCAPSNIVLLAGNNGVLLQPFSLNNSSVTKLQKLELDPVKPVVERDVFVLRVCDATWCAVFRHGGPAVPGPTEASVVSSGARCVRAESVRRDVVWLMPISGPSNLQYTHILKTGLSGRFAVSIVDDLMRVDSATWVMFQPEYIIDARLGCLWRVQLSPDGLAHSIPKDEISSIIAVLLRRAGCRPTIYRILNQLVTEAGVYLVQLSRVFDEINAVYSSGAAPARRLPAHHLPHPEPARDGGRRLPRAAVARLRRDQRRLQVTIVAVLLRRAGCRSTIYRILNQLVTEAGVYLVQLSRIFDEINAVYRKWADAEVARNTAGSTVLQMSVARHVVVSQSDMCTHITESTYDNKYCR